MKKEYNDLGVDEKKEYLFLKYATVDIPMSLMFIFVTLVAILTTIIANKFFGSIMYLFGYGLVMYELFKHNKAFKKLYDL